MSSVTIDRFELVFLNPEENRWQMFQETDGESWDGAMYRSQAQHLLSSVRKAFRARCVEFTKSLGPKATQRPASLIDLDCALEKKIGASGAKYKGQHLTAINCLDSGNVEKKNIRIDINEFRKVLNRACTKGDTRVFDFGAHLSAIGNQLNEIVRLEKIPESPHLRVFAALRDQLEEITLTRDEALSLVSTLFIARHWDVPGKFSFPDEVRSQTNDVPCAAAVPVFSYSICYRRGAPTRKKTDAEHALDYEVDVQVVGAKKCPGVWEPYFELCHDPNEPEETFWYSFYGFLIDSVNSNLSGPNLVKGEKERVHIVCLPLRICGYDHFLQLYFRLDDPEVEAVWDADLSDLTMAALLDKAYPDHRGRKTTVPFRTLLKECLRELLVQIHIAAFQHYVLDDLKRRKEPKLEKQVGEIFGQHAPNLVRLSRISLSEICFQYCDDPERPFMRWRRQGNDPFISLPSTAQIASKPHWSRIADETAGCVVADIPWEGFLEGALNPLFLGTGRQRLIEQYQWVVRQIELRDTLVALAGQLINLE